MNISSNISLLSHNTFRMRVNCAVWAEYDNENELRELLQRYAGSPVMPIGEGSNLLFTGDYAGVLLHSRMCKARALQETADEVWIEAESGLRLDDLILQLSEMDLRGMENLSHIPGTVGASAVQNVGAYGVEAKDVIMQVVALNRQTLEKETISADDCRFGYRYSRFKDEWRDRYIVLSVVYRLYKQGHIVLDYGNLSQVFASCNPNTVSPSEVREAIINIRRHKLPEIDQYGSAGSFFKNPVITTEQFASLQAHYADIPHFSMEDGVKIPAAWLIDKSGCKELQSGGAQVWDKQPLVIVNSADATPHDVMLLAEKVQQSVKCKFDIDLLPEVQYV